MLSAIMPRVIVQTVIALSVIMPSVIMQTVITLSVICCVIKLGVTMQSVNKVSLARVLLC
jgi:hypothetical protein